MPLRPASTDSGQNIQPARHRRLGRLGVRRSDAPDIPQMPRVSDRGAQDFTPYGVDGDFGRGVSEPSITIRRGVDYRNVEQGQGRRPIRKAVKKDLHLVEAALATDETVVSLDERAQADLLLEATAKITWVNANAEGGHAIYWLRRGAKPVKKWQLGSAIL